MKHSAWILFLLPALGLGAAPQSASGSKQAPSAAPKPAAKAKPDNLSVPPGAEKLGEGLWRAKDRDGKVWLYKRTPFGIVRYEDGGAKDEPESQQPEIRVVKAGANEIVFERRTPFGARTWTRSPADLDGAEKRALEQWQKSAAKQ